jgi:uncharacterized membrane protein YjfL (UPF0719 family)
MSGDEVFALIISAVLALLLWVQWYRQVVIVRAIGPTRASRLPLSVGPLLCAVVLFAVLRRFAAHDVRDSGRYLAFYVVMGAAWVGVASRLLPWFGVSPRLDALERRNGAASLAIGGALLGLTLAFAGANIGDGPGWYVVLFAALLSTGALLLGWALLETLTLSGEAVTIERDTASGLRLAGMLTAAGLILGRAAAGDWVSAAATVRDFIRIGWPVLILLAAEAVLHRVLRPSQTNPAPGVVVAGVMPALLYVAGAAIYVVRVGPW